MNIEDPRFEEYEARFRTLAERVGLQKGPQAELASAQQHLFLYGDNGASPDEELATLAQFERMPERLCGLEMLTGYWEDIALYVL